MALGDSSRRALPSMPYNHYGSAPFRGHDGKNVLYFAHGKRAYLLLSGGAQPR